MSALFSSNKIEDFVSVKNREASAKTFVNGNEQTIAFKKNDELSRCIPFIAKNCNIHYATAGTWSTHELLEHLLSLTGPAHVYFCTWSIKEYPVRMLINLIDQGRITGMHCLLDNRVKTQTPEVFHLVKLHAVKARQSVCHAKVTVIENDEWQISITGSANYTNNPRIEAGVIAISKEVADFNKSWIMAELNQAHPFDDQ